MLLQRVITAVVLVTLFLLANFLLPEPVFALLVTAMILAATWEWSRLGGISEPVFQWLYVFLMFVLLCAVYLVKDSWGTGLLAFGALWWGFRLVLLVTERLSKQNEKILLSGLWALMIAWLSMLLLHQISPAVLLAGLVMVWGADSFAYFAGKRFGRHKLAPAISPGKTVEGVMGGVTGVLVLAVLIAYLLKLDMNKWLWWLLGAAFISLISVVGDLYESWMKRNVGVKDSGSLLPGHGGVLDRIDGMIAALPFYYLLIKWLLVND